MSSQGIGDANRCRGRDDQGDAEEGKRESWVTGFVERLIAYEMGIDKAWVCGLNSAEGGEGLEVGEETSGAKKGFRKGQLDEFGWAAEVRAIRAEWGGIREGGQWASEVASGLDA